MSSNKVPTKSSRSGESLKERAERQRLERRDELTYTEKDEARWAKNRKRALAMRKEAEKNTLDLD